MKILLLLACLVPLALARQKEALSVSAETSQSVSSSEESITHIKEKLQKIKHEEQQQRQAARQASAPYAAPMSYAVLPPSLQPVVQPAVVFALPQEPQPQMMASVAEPEAALPRGAPALVSVPFPFPAPIGLQIPAHPLLQPAVQQLLRALLLPVQSAQPAPESKAPHVRHQVQPSAQTHASALRLLQLLRALQTQPAPQAPEYVSVAV